MPKLKLITMLFAIVLIGAGCSKASEQSNVFNSTEDSSDNSSVVSEVPAPGVDPSTVDEMIVRNNDANQIITLKTNLGDIKIELYTVQSPITAGNFLKLAKEDYYDGITFHRVIPNFMIQGGDPLSKDDDPSNDGTGGPGYNISDEFIKGLTNVRGTIAMANSGPETGGSQFFINVKDNANLNYSQDDNPGYTVFGRVTEGMDVTDAMVSVETTTKNGMQDVPAEPVFITSARLVD